jgi:hypothetical protein
MGVMECRYIGYNDNIQEISWRMSMIVLGLGAGCKDAGATTKSHTSS